MTRPEPARAAGREPVRSGPVPPQPIPVSVPVPPPRQLDGSFARGLAWTSAARFRGLLRHLRRKGEPAVVAAVPEIP